MTLYDFNFNAIDGTPFDVSTLEGKKVLIVNTASECGLTPQYEQLEELYQAKKDSNFTIIGFPSNDFGAQEPGTNDEIAQFCTKNYGVSFPMMEKITVKGENIHPLYDWLTKESESEVSWNFQKFLIDENGVIIKSFAPTVLPVDEEILTLIEN